MLSTQFIRSIKLKRDRVKSFNDYPFCLPAIKGMKELTLHPKVTYFVGENGSGKSTILEAIAVQMNFNPEGGSNNFKFSTVETHSDLYQYFTLVKGIKRPKNGYFLRAESFYNVASEIDRLDQEPAPGPRIIDSYGGVSLHKQSHGESFFSLFMNRFGSNSLYILDEPEAALSPQRQMTMISQIHNLVKNGCQFIIATHPPIMLSYPHSTIYEIRDTGCEKVSYEDTDTYTLTKQYVNQYQSMLEILLEE